MGRQVFYMAGFIGGFAKTIKGIGKSIRISSDFGSKYGKIGGRKLAGKRMNYLDDANAFKVGKMNDDQVEEAISIVTNNPKILNDLAEGNLTRTQARGELSKLFNDAGVRSTPAQNRKLADKVVRHSMDHTNKSKIGSYFFGGVTKEQAGGVAGSAAALGVLGIIVYGVGAAISARLGGAFDKLLDAAAESETGTYVMMGVVIVGSILAINFVRETIT